MYAFVLFTITFFATATDITRKECSTVFKVCENTQSFVRSFSFYSGSETQKSLAKSQAETFAKKIAGKVVERSSRFDVFTPSTKCFLECDTSI